MSRHVYESMSHSKYHGLFNQGSTCYLNSVLQVLFMTKEFREAVQSYEGDSESLDFHLKNLFKELTTSTASTKEISKVLGIKDFLQSDAAGCLENILSKMKSPGTSQLFQGTLTNKKICCKCEKLTKTDDPFWSLPLELGDYDGHGLDYFMKNYFKESVLSGADQLYCERCSIKTDTTIKVEMKDHPEVLTLLLKRFKFDNYYRGYVKVKCRVEIPDCLQMPNKSQFYQLYAYVEHYGELKYGHYVVTIKAQDDDEWYTFNDSYVSLLSGRKNCHINSTSYLLFYRKMPAKDSLNADDSGAFTSQDFKSDQPRRSNMELKEEQKDEKDQLMSTGGNPPEDGKLLKRGTIGTESTKVGSQHSKPLEQDASADLQSDLHKNPDNNEGITGRHGSKRMESSDVLSKSTNVNEQSHKKCRQSLKNGQCVQILEQLYTICVVATDKNEEYLLLKTINQTSGEVFSKQNPCRNPDCKINKLNCSHTHPSEELREEAYKLCQETETVQRITGLLYAPNEKPMLDISQTRTANKLSVKDDSGECNQVTSQASKNTPSQTGANLQKSLALESSGSIEALSSNLGRMRLSDPNDIGNQRVSTKSETYTGNQPLTQMTDKM